MNLSSLLPSASNPQLSGQANTNAEAGDGTVFASLLAGQITEPAQVSQLGALDPSASSASSQTLLGVLLAGQASAQTINTRSPLHLALSKDSATLGHEGLDHLAAENGNSRTLTAASALLANQSESAQLEPEVAQQATELLATQVATIPQIATASETAEQTPGLTSDLVATEAQESAANSAIPLLRAIDPSSPRPTTSNEFAPAASTRASSGISNTLLEPNTTIALKSGASDSLSAAIQEPAKSAGMPEPFQLPQAAQGTEGRPGPTRSDATHSIATPLHDPRWSQQLGDRVVWMTRGEIQNAQININPAQLGPIQINISLNGDQMTANFIAAHQEVRQALDDAMPRLREMLSSAGINLGQTNVGSQTPQQQGAGTFSMSSNPPRSTVEDVILSPVDSINTGARPINQGRGLVDLFA